MSKYDLKFIIIISFIFSTGRDFVPSIRAHQAPGADVDITFYSLPKCRENKVVFFFNLSGLHSDGGLLALLKNVRLGFYLSSVEQTF